MYNPLALLLAFIRIILIVITLFIFVLPLLIVDKLFNISPKSAFRFRRAWVSIAKVILGITVQIKGKPYEGTALYLSLIHI